MTKKDYLSQARYLDINIDTKIEQLSMLNSLATKATAVLSDMPHSPNRGSSSLEDTICKIIDLQDEINRDIDHLVDLKKEIEMVINAVPDLECKLILTKRYLCYMNWETIAVETNYSIDNVFRIHRKGLGLVQIPHTIKLNPLK